jgi:hypothetical protein
MLRCVSRLLGKSKAARAEDEATTDMKKKKFVHPYSQHIPQIQKFHIFAESIKYGRNFSWLDRKQESLLFPVFEGNTLTCVHKTVETSTCSFVTHETKRVR